MGLNCSPMSACLHCGRQESAAQTEVVKEQPSKEDGDDEEDLSCPATMGRNHRYVCKSCGDVEGEKARETARDEDIASTYRSISEACPATMGKPHQFETNRDGSETCAFCQETRYYSPLLIC